MSRIVSSGAHWGYCSSKLSQRSQSLSARGPNKEHLAATEGAIPIDWLAAREGSGAPPQFGGILWARMSHAGQKASAPGNALLLLLCPAQGSQHHTPAARGPLVTLGEKRTAVTSSSPGIGWLATPWYVWECHKYYAQQKKTGNGVWNVG